MTNHAVYSKLIILSYWNTPSDGSFVKSHSKDRTAVHAVFTLQSSSLCCNDHSCKRKTDTKAVIARVFSLIKALEDMR